MTESRTSAKDQDVDVTFFSDRAATGSQDSMSSAPSRLFEVKRQAFFLLRILAASRILFFPGLLLQYLKINIWRKLKCGTRKHDPMYFLVHKYYLSKRLTVKERIQSAIEHHAYELKNFNRLYESDVYRGIGIIIWERRIDDHRFSIILTGSEDNRNEGELSIIFTADSQYLWRTSFSYVNSDIFQLHHGVTILISRNQAEDTSYRGLFIEYFGQNQLQFLCLSAVCGIATANGWTKILCIRHNLQIAYEDRYEIGFRNSYTILWQQFDAREIDRHVYELDVPLKVRPLQLINRSHRARARARRQYWDSITCSARTALIGYRLF